MDNDLWGKVSNYSEIIFVKDVMMNTIICRIAAFPEDLIVIINKFSIDRSDRCRSFKAGLDQHANGVWRRNSYLVWSIWSIWLASGIDDSQL